MKKEPMNPPQQQLMLFQEGSRNHASHSQQPASEKEKTILETSGRNTLELLESLNQPTLLARMLVDSSAWKMAGHLKGYSLIWKARGTRWNRLLFRLAVLGRGIGETEYGLLATPNTMDSLPPKDEEMTKNHPGRPGRTKSGNLREQIAYDQVLLPTPFYTRGSWTKEEIEKRQAEVKEKTNSKKGGVKTGNGFGMNLEQAAKMLPTPNARDYKSPKRVNSSSPYSMLNEEVYKQEKQKLLPTPRASEYKSVGPLDSKSHKHMLDRGYLCAVVQEKEQKTGHLNPEWVEWLQGYPIGWTDLKA